MWPVTEQKDIEVLQNLFADNVQRTYIADGHHRTTCLLYTSDAADERSSVDLGGRRIIKKKKKQKTNASGKQ